METGFDPRRGVGRLPLHATSSKTVSNLLIFEW